MRHLLFRSAILAGVAALLAGCSTNVASTKAGGDLPPLRLSIGTDDTPGRPGANQIQYFAEQVSKLSDGRIQVRPSWRAAGEPADDWDQAVAGMVVDGELDLAMVPARAWDTEGVDSLRALHAPLLVDSEELLAAAVTDDVAQSLMSGFDDTGVVALSLLPESLRYLFLVGDTWVGADGLVGMSVRSPESRTTHSVLEALGAAPADDLTDSELKAAETSFQLAGTVGGPGASPLIAAGNLPLFPKVNVLVANRDVFDDLGPADQALLREAAELSRDWAVEQIDERAAAETFCQNGGTVIQVPEADLAKVREATAPVLRELEADPGIAATVRALESLRDGLDAESFEAPTCRPEDAGPARPAGSTQAFPDGIYRMEVSEQELRDAGVTPVDAANHAGVWTLTFEDGTFLVEDVVAATGESHSDRGVYCVEGDRVRLGIEPIGTGECGTFWSAEWTLQDDELEFVDLTSHFGDDRLITSLFGGRPWTKVG
jgi:TRAP-type C4-dicarboxylate transport system substrate-binding protein